MWIYKLCFKEYGVEDFDSFVIAANSRSEIYKLLNIDNVNNEEHYVPGNITSSNIDSCKIIGDYYGDAKKPFVILSRVLGVDNEVVQ